MGMEKLIGKKGKIGVAVESILASLGRVREKVMRPLTLAEADPKNPHREQEMRRWRKTWGVVKGGLLGRGDYVYDENGCLRRAAPKARGMKKKERRKINREARAHAKSLTGSPGADHEG